MRSNVAMIEENPDLDPVWIDRIRGALRSWYEHGHRDLPWRRDRDAYRILVSETMLVQTTVAAVIPFFERFLKRFPDVRALAAADETDVLKAWEGLGYYRRARHLHASAKAIVRDHDGVVPDDLEAILALPGVGRYIAGAVLSFAYDIPAPIVEANTQRLLARLLALPDDLAKGSTQKRLWQAAERLVPLDQPGRFNQAFMEIGGTVCTPRDPKCLLCPICDLCRAKMRGLQHQIPRKSPKAAPLEATESCALVVRDNQWLMVQRGPGGLWDGFWEFPTVHCSGADPAGRSVRPDESLADAVLRLTGVHVEAGQVAKTLRYSVTKHRVELTAHFAKDCGSEIIPYPGIQDVKFVDSVCLSDMAMGSATRKLAKFVTEEAF